MHRKRIMLIGYSKEREEELRQYWDNEIRDQRKWTRGMNLFWGVRTLSWT